MTRYRAVIELEAEQWEICNSPSGEMGSQMQAKRIVAWVIANGGEARYEPDHPWTEFGTPCVCNGGNEQQPSYPHRARLAIRRADGWVYAKPGEYIVMGMTWFAADSSVAHHDTHQVRDHYPCAELSELRLLTGIDWHPVGDTHPVVAELRGPTGGTTT